MSFIDKAKTKVEEMSGAAKERIADDERVRGAGKQAESRARQAGEDIKSKAKEAFNR